MPKVIGYATLREIASGTKKLVTYYYDDFYITRSVRRAQGDRKPSGILNRTTHSKRVRVKRSRRLMSKFSRRRNR